jgi:hypothetical protein
LALALGRGGIMATLASSQEVSRDTFFELDLPKGFELKKAVPVFDVIIYTVSREGRDYAKIYIGNHPDVSEDLAPGHRRFELPIGTSTIISTYNSNALVRRQFLLTLKGDKWPTRLHAWTCDLPEGLLPVADMILFSLKPKG